METEGKTVKRYDIKTKPYHEGATMEQSPDGEWVSYEDYEDVKILLDACKQAHGQLTQENERLKEDIINVKGVANAKQLRLHKLERENDQLREKVGKLEGYIKELESKINIKTV